MKELIGKKLKALYLSSEQDRIMFETEEGDIVYYADAECCSETWFADITTTLNLKTGVPRVITNVIELPIPLWMQKLAETDGRTRQEEDKVYGYRLIFGTWQELDIIYRNSSNGYYGGWCELEENFPKDVVWIKIDEDYSA